MADTGSVRVRMVPDRMRLGMGAALLLGPARFVAHAISGRATLGAEIVAGLVALAAVGLLRRALPRLRLNPAVRDLDAFRFEDFTLEAYDPHPAIRAPGTGLRVR